MGERVVKINVLNWDVCMWNDLQSGKGFIISDPAQISVDGQSKKTEFGPQSPRFGTTYGDEQEFIERYRCKCGAFKGKLYKNETCPFCEDKVTKKDIDVGQTGWINFGRFKFINPYYYQMLVKLLGKKVFPDIIDTRQRVDVNGHVSTVELDELKESYSPFSGIGISGFLERYEEVLTYFMGKKKDKADDIEKLLKLKTAVFTSNCPVYTTLLRPQSATSDTLYYTGIDKEINPLIRLSLDIDDCEPIELPLILYRIQTRVNKMWEFNFQLINSKEGFIRDKLLGGSLNFSARNVITPDPTLKDDEIDMSYQTFRILFQYQIINTLKIMDHIPLSKAYDRWKRSFVFDQYIYEIMKFIIKEYKPMVLINRNPTLNYYSMLLMKIRNVKKCDLDYTLSVGLSILPGLNADFDGDILNMFAIMHDEFIKMFSKFSPTDRMIIDRATGLLNSYFAIEKSQLIDLYYFFTC